jgi:hypothetical protein
MLVPEADKGKADAIEPPVASFYRHGRPSASRTPVAMCKECSGNP